MRFPLPACLVIFSCMMLSCNSSGSRSERIHEGDTQVGKVIPDVACSKDTSIRYALYLPSVYNTGKKYPVILAFDPHASGYLPVEKYDSLAEQYGYILIGSNNSKNGLPMNDTEKIINVMLPEIFSRHSVDSSRIYLMGFSGGARIASLVALYRGGIRGVIGCGAGFPGNGQPGRFRFDYIGFAGNEDFNMNELVSLDEHLEEAKFRHALIIFDGRHEWPPARVMEYAFLWNEFCAMKDGNVETDRLRIADFSTLVNQSVRQAVDKKDLYRKKIVLEQKIRFLQGIKSVNEEKKELAQLISSGAYKVEEKKINGIKVKEAQEQGMFTENFFLKDLTWWSNRISDIEYRISNSNDPEEVLMYKRIKSYLSLLANMNYTRAESSGDQAKADFSRKVYRIVNPENAAKIR